MFRFVAIVGFAWLVIGCGGGGGGSSGASGGDAGGNSNWIIPSSQVVDGGPGRDGIPALDTSAGSARFVDKESVNEWRLMFVMGYKTGDAIRAAPFSIMDYHEVLNDQSGQTSLVLSYCPLTGSPLGWDAGVTGERSFGVSGLLYKSNLILFDRATDSHWSQMLEQAVEGARVRERPKRIPVVQMTFEGWTEMYPDAQILSRNTGFDRPYDRFPYGGYRTSNELLFSVGTLDTRKPSKLRVVGVNVGTSAIAYPINDFDFDNGEVLNESLDGVPYVVLGHSGRLMGTAYARTLSDGTVLTFARSTDPFPAFMVDDQTGSSWDVFGTAIAGDLEGEQLGVPGGEAGRVQVAYWFAWAAFNANSAIWEP